MSPQPELARARPRGALVLLLVAVLVLWTCVVLRYDALSAVPFRPLRVGLHVALLTLAHWAIGRALFGLLARREPPAEDRWAWHLLLGYGTAPVLLWAADQLGSRAVGWGLLALLVAAGLALALAQRLRRSERPSPSGDALGALALLACLAGATLVGLDHVLYLRPAADGVLWTAPEDDLVHAGFALEWARQQPFHHLWQGFAPEQLGIAYHYLTDVQLGAWWTLCGGEHLDFIHRERFLLQGLALLVGIYLLARALLVSRTWALLACAFFAACPYWLLDLEPIPQKESLQRLWTSFTFQNGTALSAGFLASLWMWIQRGQAGFARIALALAGPVLLAKAYFAVLSWAAGASLVLFTRPRAWMWWLAGLALVGGVMLALQPHGPDVIPMLPEWQPGRCWKQLWLFRADTSHDGRGFGNLLDWVVVGLGVLAVGGVSAGIALRRAWPSSAAGRGLVLVIAVSWAVYLVYISLLWFFSTHETAFQFLPWLAVLSVLVGLAGCRAAIEAWSERSPRVRSASAAAGLALWALVLVGAGVRSEGFGRPLWPTTRFTPDTWATLDYLRTHTPRTSRVLAPFESGLMKSKSAEYAISGVAGRRAVDEHAHLADALAGLAERIWQRKQHIANFYRDPQPAALEFLAREWDLDYVVLGSQRVARIPESLARTVFSTPEWSVLELRAP